MPRPEAVCKEICFNEKLVSSVKSRISEENFHALAEIYKLLANPTRLKIIYALDKGELCVCDIANVVGLSISAVSQQLKLLRAGGILRYRTDGKMAYYSLISPNLYDAIRNDARFIISRAVRPGK